MKYTHTYLPSHHHRVYSKNVKHVSSCVHFVDSVGLVDCNIHFQSSWKNELSYTKKNWLPNDDEV
jgi:hypothetical protein